MSQLIFDPETGLYSPQTEGIREAVATDWTSAFADPRYPELNTEPSTPAGQLVDAETAEIEAKNAELLFLANQFNPFVSEGRWQQALGNLYFITPQVSTFTTVTCQLTGLRNTFISYGSQARTDDGYTLICNNPVAIGDNGTASTTFRLTESGPIEVLAGTVNTIITTIPGWDTISNVAAGATGQDRESRAEFESRRFKSVAANSHGTVGAIYGTMANLPGVLDVQVLENIGPDPVIKYGVTVPGHGVTICIYGGENQDIARVIYEKKDAGCDTGGNTILVFTDPDYSHATYEYLILRPTTINFWVQITLGATSTVTPEIQANIQEAVLTDFLGTNTHTQAPRVGLAQDVYASRFYHAITAVQGVENLLSVQIALSDSTPSSGDYVDFITILGNQEPVLTTPQIVFVLES